MRAVIQRVTSASVEVEGRVTGKIVNELLVYVSVSKQDCEKDAEYISEKISGLRIFSDQAGKMNLSVQDIKGEILIISNFTLHGDCRRGRRPGFDAAGESGTAGLLYEKTIQLIRGRGIITETGIFGANMQVKSVNDGPVTILLDSSRIF